MGADKIPGSDARMPREQFQALWNEFVAHAEEPKYRELFRHAEWLEKALLAEQQAHAKTLAQGVDAARLFGEHISELRAERERGKKLREALEHILRGDDSCKGCIRPYPGAPLNAGHVSEIAREALSRIDKIMEKA